jgi:hypothetical protein
VTPSVSVMAPSFERFALLRTACLVAGLARPAITIVAAVGVY